MRFDADPLFRALHDKVSTLFAEQLKKDMDNAFEATFGTGTSALSAACRHAPVPYKSYDKRTLLSEGIARRLFPSHLPAFQGLSEREWAFRARDRLRGLLNILREHTKLPERLISEGRWQEVDYANAAPECLRKHAKMLCKQDPAFSRSQPQRKRSDRWAALEQMRPQNTIVVCDVSERMRQRCGPGLTCMAVASALLTRLAACATGAGRDAVLTFEEEPRLVPLEDPSSIRALPYGESFNLERALELLATFPQPVERILVLTADEPSAPSMPELQSQGVHMPEIIYWRLGEGPPKVSSPNGIVAIGGYSPMVLEAVAKALPGEALEATKVAAAPVKAVEEPKMQEEDCQSTCDSTPDGCSEACPEKAEPLLTVRSTRKVAGYFVGTENWGRWMQQVAANEFGELDALRADLEPRVALAGRSSLWVDLSPGARNASPDMTVNVTVAARVAPLELKAAVTDLMAAVDKNFTEAAALLKRREQAREGHISEADRTMLANYY
jgi:hypothetical protein